MSSATIPYIYMYLRTSPNKKRGYKGHTPTFRRNEGAKPETPFGTQDGYSYHARVAAH